MTVRKSAVRHQPAARSTLLVALLAAGAWHPTVLAAQAGSAVGGDSDSTLEWNPTASPPLPPDHWAVAAAARAEALGLVPGYLPAQRSVPRARVGAVLREAATAARAGYPQWVELTQGWVVRFANEFREPHLTNRIAPVRVYASAGVAYAGREGFIAPGSGLFGGRIAPVLRPDQTDAAALARLAVSPMSWLSAVMEPRIGTDGAAIPRWDLVAAAGPVALSVGREPVGYGYGRGGGIVLSGVLLPRIEVQTARPIDLPGWLGLLGPATAHTFLSRMDEGRHPGDPFFWGMRAAVRPHPRLTVAVNRAALFGGDSVSAPVTPLNFARLLTGKHTDDFENQIVTAEFRFRLPTEAVLPATAYLEWGSEDSSGGWWDVPGTLLGVYLPSFPGIAEVAVGAEWTRFPTHCCGNPPWYFHAAFPGGWVADDVPLGHPLGGEGSETLLYADADLPKTGVRLGTRVFRRSRGTAGFDTAVRAGNLYAPVRGGVSWGGSVEAAWRPFPRSELTASYFTDRGSDWAEQRMLAGARVFF